MSEVKPYSTLQHTARSKGNAAAFDRHHYAQEKNSVAHVEHLGKVDESLWKKAQNASKEAFGEERGPFVSWWYQKQGGTFNDGDGSSGASTPTSITGSP